MRGIGRYLLFLFILSLIDQYAHKLPDLINQRCDPTQLKCSNG
jgi:hypothetical protein